MKLATLLLLLCTHSVIAQINKQYQSPLTGFGGGDVLQLKEDGTYTFSTSTCLSYNEGSGQYRTLNDSLYILSYTAGEKPFKILQSSSDIDSVIIHFEKYDRNIIRGIYSNRNDILYTADRDSFIFSNPASIKVSNKGIERILIVYDKPDRRNTDSLYVDVKQNNSLTISEHIIFEYNYPQSLYTKWRITSDTLFVNPKLYLVDSSISRNIFDELK